MDIILTSDLHGNLPDMSQYSGDMLIIAGDICPNFKWDRFNDSMYQLNWLTQIFMPWCKTIKVDHIIIIPGNHDIAFEDMNNLVREILSHDNRIKLLIDQSATIAGINFYGTPWVKPVGNWAFLASGDKMKSFRDIIPKNVDVLISHSPPYGLLDFCPFQKEHYGCKYLLDTLPTLTNCKLMCWGHIHKVIPNELDYNGLKIINAAEAIFKVVI